MKYLATDEHIKEQIDRLGLEFVRKYKGKKGTRIVYICPKHREKVSKMLTGLIYGELHMDVNIVQVR